MRTNKQIAWITIPAYISVDRFVIPEISKIYNVDWYLLRKDSEKIDFERELLDLKDTNKINLKIIDIKYKNSDFRIIKDYYRFLKSLKNQYDIYYTVMFGMPFYMPILYAILGKQNTIVAIHNVHVPKGASNYYFSKLYNFFTVNKFDYFQTFSKSQNEYLLSKKPKKHSMSTSFALINYGEIKQKSQTEIVTFLSFGYIRDYKRIDVLILAAQKAYEITKTNFKVIIAGSCDDWDKYNNLIKYPFLFKLIIRRIDEKEIPLLFEESDYFVAPYQDIAQSASIVLALNYNKPIIGSKLDAFKDYIIDKETGFFIKPANYEDLTRVFVYVLNNHSNIYSYLSDNIIELKKKEFSLDAIVNNYVMNIDYVLKNGRR